MLAAFEEASARQIGEIVRGTEAVDAAHVSRAAHTLKGSAANVGASRMAGLASEVERRAQLELRGPGVEQLAALGRERDAALAALRQRWHRI